MLLLTLDLYRFVYIRHLFLIWEELVIIVFSSICSRKYINVFNARLEPIQETHILRKNQVRNV